MFEDFLRMKVTFVSSWRVAICFAYWLNRRCLRLKLLNLHLKFTSKMSGSKRLRVTESHWIQFIIPQTLGWFWFFEPNGFRFKTLFEANPLHTYPLTPFRFTASIPICVSSLNECIYTLHKLQNANSGRSNCNVTDVKWKKINKMYKRQSVASSLSCGSYLVQVTFAIFTWLISPWHNSRDESSAIEV